MRACGECQQCCETAEILDVGSPAGSPCPHQCATGCGLQGDASRPPVCGDFQCAWLRGIGAEADRPDLVGAMFSINRTGNGLIGFVIETAPDALRTTARAMAVAFVTQANLPLVVVSYGTTPPHDVGDRLVLRKAHVLRAIAMRGPHLEDLDDGVGLYALARRAA